MRDGDGKNTAKTWRQGRSSRARRRRMRQNIDREWYHIWHNRHLNTVGSKFLSESCASNLRPGTWCRWLSACLRKHLMCAREPWLWLENLHISSRGTLSAHSAVILTLSDIFSRLCPVPYDMTNKSLTEVFLRYSLASPVVAHPCT